MAEAKEHVNVNSIGALVLFHAVLPLLLTISSPLCSIGGMETKPFSMGAYGISKATLNYLTRKIYFENDNLVAFALNPG